MPVSSTSRSVIAVAIGNLAAPAAAFATAPILAHALGVEGRGEVAAGSAFLLLATAIGTLGLSDAATYFIAARLAQPGAVLRAASIYLAASGIGLTVVSYFVAPILAAHDPELTTIVRIAGLAITPTLVLGALRGVAQGAQRWTLVNLEKYLTAVFRVAPLLGLLALGSLTPLTAVVTLAGAPIVGGLAYLGLMKRMTADVVERAATAPHLFKYGMHVWVGALSGIVLSRIDQTLITPLSGVYELGLYAVAVNLADLLLIGQGAIGQVLFAVDARDRSDGRMYLGSRLSILASVVFAVLVAVPVVFWIRVLFGEDFAPAASAVLILLGAHVVGAPGSIAGTATSARGRPGLRSLAILVAAIVNVLLLVCLVPSFGATGAAIATLAGTIVGTIMNICFAWRVFGMNVVDLCVPRLGDIGALYRIVRR